MSITNNFVFKALTVMAWIIFIGLCIEAGGLVVNFIFSLYKPEFIQNLYQKLDLTSLYTNSKLTFFGVYGLILIISILKAILFYVVIKLMNQMDLSNPFHIFVAKKIYRISYYTLIIGLISYIAKAILQDMIQENLNQFWAGSEAFILMGAVIYIIAVIFKKGVDIQNENDLTI